jgi:hypothetical protein
MDTSILSEMGFGDYTILRLFENCIFHQNNVELESLNCCIELLFHPYLKANEEYISGSLDSVSLTKIIRCAIRRFNRSYSRMFVFSFLWSFLCNLDVGEKKCGESFKELILAHASILGEALECFSIYLTEDHRR